MCLQVTRAGYEKRAKRIEREIIERGFDSGKYDGCCTISTPDFLRWQYKLLPK